MEIKLQQGRLTDIEADVALVFAGDKQAPRDAGLNQATAGWLDEIYASGEFGGKPGDLAVLHRPANLKVKRLAVAGLGKDVRKAVGAAFRGLKSKSVKSVHVVAESTISVQDLVEAAILADFEPDQLRSDPEKGNRRIELLTVVVEQAGDDVRQALERGRILAESQNFTRELVNEPSNRLTPMVLAERARAMAGEVGLECDVLEEPQLRELGMGALLGVAQGSDNPPALIVLRYSPQGAADGKHLALVGKGVTFDSGGISIKPSEGMEKMKYDMGGGAAVLGAMRAIALLKPKAKVTAFVPTVENMVSGRAQRPGDIVTSMSGKTIEVLNTDAEGRLILADALTYAIRQGCTHLVDAATLTGAIVVALGHVHVGAFTNNEEFLGKVMQAASAAGDRMWHMPLDEDYKDYLKSAFADLPNIGGRWGGAITAAKFLEEFVEEKPWVHLDIAGTAWLDDAKPHMAKGPTGVPVRTFVNLVLNLGA